MSLLERLNYTDPRPIARLQAYFTVIPASAEKGEGVLPFRTSFQGTSTGAGTAAMTYGRRSIEGRVVGNQSGWGGRPASHEPGTGSG